MHECVVPYQRLKIIFAHLGGFGGFDTRTADIFESILDVVIATDIKDRIYFDISSIFFRERPIGIVPAFEERERFEVLLKKIEENDMLGQLIYGSDYPFVEHTEYLANIRELWPAKLSVLDDILCNEIVVDVKSSP